MLDRLLSPRSRRSENISGLVNWKEPMTTPLHSTLKRALTIEGREYVVTLTEGTLKLTLKGKRNGVELAWAQLVNGEAALAVALHASVGAFVAQQEKPSINKPLSAKPPTVKPPAKRPPAKPIQKKRASRKR
jgi:hypothetical protein